MLRAGTLERSMAKHNHWIFGYGSLIYKVDFPYLSREIATVYGWRRRFWQGSHDHRGTPDAPGRVVTLVPDEGATCKGVAYLVEESVFEHLDYREKNGYERVDVEIYFNEPGESATGTFYIAAAGNHAYLGPLPMNELAAHIAQSHGPSGSNADYVVRLAQSLRELGESDAHVEELEDLLLRHHL